MDDDGMELDLGMTIETARGLLAELTVVLCTVDGGRFPLLEELMEDLPAVIAFAEARRG